MQTSIDIDTALRRARPSLREKMLYSIQLLKKAERLALAYDKDDGFFLAFSGGKDSQALFHIAQLAGVKFRAHMNLTSMDPPEVIRFVRRCYPEVELIPPRISIYNLALKKKELMTMRFRWCCAEYKEKAGAGKVTLTGIRNEESTRRSKRKEVEIKKHKFSGTLENLDSYRQTKNKKKRGRNMSPVTIVNAQGEQTVGCIHGKESLLISPIIHWTQQDVWNFLNDVVQVEHCSLYDEGYTRIGCILCPMSSLKTKYNHITRYPHVKRLWVNTIKKMRQEGFITAHDFNRNGSNGSEEEIAENIFDWWISGLNYEKWYAEKFQQLTFDFNNDDDSE